MTKYSINLKKTKISVTHSFFLYKNQQILSWGWLFLNFDIKDVNFSDRLNYKIAFESSVTLNKRFFLGFAAS